jgi:CO dehydrogenase nickel-insertion accessory protein CooC1
MGNHTKPLAGLRIGVFGKGGAGKSTATVLLAKALLNQGYEVCVLDADSTNIGLAQALGFTYEPKSLLDFFGGMVFQGGQVTCPVDDPTLLAGAEVALHDLPPDYYVQSAQGLTLLIAGKIGDQGPGAGCDGPIAKIARDFHLTDQKNLVSLIDFKAGFEDSARGVITGLDWALVVVDPTRAAIQMAGHFKALVDRIKAGELPATRHLETPDMVALANQIFTQSRVKGVLVVLNKVQNQEMQQHMQTALLMEGIEPIGVIQEDRRLSAAWLRGDPLRSKEFYDAERIVAALEAIEAIKEIMEA